MRPAHLKRVMKNRPKSEPGSEVEEPLWKSEPGEPPIKSPGDLLAMMVQGGSALAETGSSAGGDTERKSNELDADERAAQGLPPRKAIISIHGKDVEECELPAKPGKRRAA